MGMYDDIVNGVSENIEIDGYPFYAENIDGEEPVNRREYQFKPILNGTLDARRGKYIQRKFSFMTTMFHERRPDEHDKIIRELSGKEVEIISPSMGGKFKAIVTFRKTIPEGSPYHTEYDVQVVEIPDKKSLIPGENTLVVPDVKKNVVEDKSNASNTAGKANSLFEMIKKDKKVINNTSSGVSFTELRNLFMNGGL